MKKYNLFYLDLLKIKYIFVENIKHWHIVFYAKSQRIYVKRNLKILMITIGGLNILFQRTSDTDRPVQRALDNQTITINESDCQGVIEEMSFEGIAVSKLNLKLLRPVNYPFQIKTNTVVMYFCLNGQLSLTSYLFEKINLFSGSHNIVYTSPTYGKMTLETGDVELFSISMPVELFEMYFPKSKQVFEDFSGKMRQGEFSKLREKPGHINHHIYRIIKEINKEQQDEALRNIFIKAKIIELLSVQLKQLCSICNTSLSINREDADKMYAVHDFILDHIGEYHSLKSLAKRVGTNEYTLKKEFKELFNTTVFGFWFDAKMEEAQQLLLKNEDSISEISEIIGYKNPQHFSTAFKKKFGLSPSRFRKNMKSNS